MRIRLFLLLFPLGLAAQQGTYEIIMLPACWQTGKLTSITRVFLLNQDSLKLLADYAPNGTAVSVNEQAISLGYCDCHDATSDLGGAVDGQGALYMIKQMPICWRIKDIGTDLTRVYLLNKNGVFVLNNFDKDGNPVSISPIGYVEWGYCNCE